MTKRIFTAIFTVALIVFFASTLLFLSVLYTYFTGEQQKQLSAETELCARGIANEGLSYLNGLVTKGYRVTLISPDGTVLYDSGGNVDKMENHLQREEVQAALKTGTGQSIRRSDTLMEQSLYSAKRLPNGDVVRLSMRRNTIAVLLLRMIQPITILIVGFIILSAILASRLSKSIVRPLNTMNLDAPVHEAIYDELRPLLNRIHAQKKQIQRQKRELRQKQKEFETVTRDMREGIVLLGRDRRIIAINPAAGRLFGSGQDCTGEDIQAVFDLPEHLLESAENHKAAETIVDLKGGQYQLSISPVTSEGTLAGMVLLLLDVTEKDKAEKIRREFTANVTHELKTPLHTLSGCAELLASGLVQPEDVPRFSKEIYAQARRMSRLVQDIIKLSHLDEGAQGLSFSQVDLYASARETIAALRVTAEEAGVLLNLYGAPASVQAVPELVSEILYNLCDNAIKYNHPGGSVNVRVEEFLDQVCLSVLDDGSGISYEDQERVFERFYRADKSHSREIPGTGLGLSIVKHAARLQDADLTLKSIPGKGTVIMVTFPKAQS